VQRRARSATASCALHPQPAETESSAKIILMRSAGALTAHADRISSTAVWRVLTFCCYQSERIFIRKLISQCIYKYTRWRTPRKTKCLTFPLRLTFTPKQTVESRDQCTQTYCRTPVDRGCRQPGPCSPLPKAQLYANSSVYIHKRVRIPLRA
jgi:hypothetical protein